MKTRHTNMTGIAAALAILMSTAGGGGPAWAAKAADGKHWRVPVVMEKATVRGKVVVLETRSEERRAVSNLTVQVWSRVEQNGRSERGRMLVETKTDDGGFFNLPVIDEGEYMLMVGDLQLKLTVVPEAPDRAGQQEPKILLLLLPKEVIRQAQG